MAAQQLFQNLPPAGPGMVTPNITADIRQNVNWGDLTAMYNLQQRMKEDRKAEWARAAAANRTGLNQGKAGEDQLRVRKAFNEMYGPQIQRKGHDIKMMEVGPEGEARRRQFGSGAGGMMPGDYFSSGYAYNKGKMPHFDYDPKETQKILDQMWRAQTDPYYRTAARMGGGYLQAMTPGGSVGGSNPAAWARMTQTGK